MLIDMPRPTFHGVARTADGARLAVQVRGEGPALLLLQGQANNHHWWDVTRGDFVSSRTTITFDYRGTGASSAPETDYSTRQFAEDAVAVLDYVGVASADVYGTSMGGRVAQWMAADAPRRVRRLVLGCTTPGGKRAVERGRDVTLLLAARDVDARSVLADLMYTPAYRLDHPGPYDTLGDESMGDQERRKHLRASNRHDAWNALPSLTAETLILHGTDDRLAPFANAGLLAERIPNARVHAFAGARHAYFEECRPEASSVVADFLGGDPY